MKLLLAATVALLLGALAVSWQGMKKGVANAPDDELARIRKQINELRRDQDNLAAHKQLQELQAAAPPPAQSAPAAEIEAMKQQLAAQQAAMAELEAAKVDEKKLTQAEEGLIEQQKLENGDAELKRARRISEALLVAKVREWVKDAQFITFDILMPETNIGPDTILAVRRKTGILGQFKVSEVTPEGGIANPLPGFGPFEPQPGDELIFPPQY